VLNFGTDFWSVCLELKGDTDQIKHSIVIHTDESKRGSHGENMNAFVWQYRL